jgi:glyoxylase-like metal-dependent hydrolase (beta-lactamase superfamily II)
MEFEVFPIKSFMANAYLIKGERIALVDTLTPLDWRGFQKKLSVLRVSPRDIEFILITHNHGDHCGNLARLKELSGATIIAGEADIAVIQGTEPPRRPSNLSVPGKIMGRIPGSILEWYQRFDPVDVDRSVSGGETIEELGLEVLALQGHTTGGMGYYDAEGRRAFIGDLVSNYRGSAGMPVLSASESVEKIYAAQDKLAGLDLDIAYPGHGAAIRPRASETIGRMLLEKRAKT